MKTLLVPRVYQPDSFAQLLERRLNLTPGFEAGRLDAEQVANLALLTVAQAPAYAGTARLVALMRSLPVPSEEPQDFWFKLWTAADDPVLLPGNLRHQLLRAVDGDGAALADQLLHAIAEMDGERRTAAAVVIGEAISTDFLRGYEAGYVGELWLREVESAAWQVLYAYDSGTWEEHQEFLQAWKEA
ncbi:hypothetical protein OG596_34245 [Streptomyces sp. NBC_01102]|uniref:hypothetical protein n=1 Tax=Streptomyces sp. NBC_01102 TaxID=2903749 RepID=UPI00386ED502|nr:hypothetical protein OG596_34245 [Streptomyces sp. NBC_01102]